ncbi:hypothetical protein KY290_010928 [Solanum tuberosum]|uniref:DUF1985 domain-containing protein n=1 Tax=Solanum tuberosum TaxID=4113 RepID=A0ABQ7W0E6_SOLTU|nr:hypothetical protein KY290_010928 [Solanum tuberosum]
MAKIDNYQDSSAQSSDDVESSNNKSGSKDESSRDTQTGDEDEDLLSLPICARDISGKSYELKTWIDEIGSFPAKIYVRARMDGEKFYYKVTKNKNITATKLMCLIKGSKLNKEEKLKCSLVLFVHTMLLAHDRSKIVDSSHNKMVDDLDFFNSYPWGKESFNLTLTYLKNKINLKRESEVYNERGNALYDLYRFPRAISGDPFKYKGKSTKVVHPYLTPIVRETKKNYLATLKPYIDEVKDTVLDTLKANLKNVIVLTSVIENVEDEYLSDHNPNQPSTDLAVDDDNFLAPIVDDEILPLAIVDDDLVVVDEYFAEEVDEVVEGMKEDKMKQEEKKQDKEKMTEK